MEETEMPEPRATGSRILTAVLESGQETRTTLSAPDAQGIYYPCWSERDALALYVDGINVADRYTLVSGAGTVKGEFSGTAYGARMVALYPYDDRNDTGLQDNVLHLTLPSVQTYREGTFSDGDYPMIAVGSPENLTFKNLCSVLKVSMTGEVAVQSIKFVAHDSWLPVSGKASVRTDFRDEPELVMDDDGVNEVKLECGFIPLDPATPTEFFLVIPPGTYRGGFSVEVKTFNGTVTRSTDADIVFKRSQVRSIPTFACVADGEIDPDDIPHNQIWYSTSDKRLFTPSNNAFDRQIVSNTYSDNKGVIVFDGPVRQIGEYAFNSTLLTDIVLPNSVETLKDYALYYSRISSFHVPDALCSVGDYAFYACDNLTRIYGRLASPDERALIMENGAMVAYARAIVEADLTIPEGVTSLAPYLFRDCEVLETAYIPESLQEMGEGAFLGCTSLREFRGNNVHIPDGHTFISDNGNITAWAGAGTVDYVMPESAKTFDSGVFRYNSTLRSITFPTLSFGGIWLTDYFRGCDNLEYFYGEGTTADHHCMIIWGNMLFAVTKVLPADYKVPGGYGITRTNGNLFDGNATVERLSLPDEIVSISYNAFSNMPRLKSLTLPASLSSLGEGSFYGTTLDTLYLRSYAPPSYDREDLVKHDGLVICVPDGFEEQYKSDPTWSKYADYIQGYRYPDLPDPDYYISKDFSRHGQVTTLQRATQGAGIDLVLMGDGFTDIQVGDGTYARYMQKMADAFFSEEPYTTLRPLFNVYSVDVVSYSEGYDHGGQALGGWFGSGTQVGGDDGKCMDFARKIIGDSRMDNVLIIVAMNSTKYAGTCYMYYPSGGDYGVGTSVAYFPIGEDDEGLAQLVHHEAGGHGFAKLDDEYSYEGTISQDEIDSKVGLGAAGWWKNVDFTADPSKVKWSRFLQDGRYQFDGLGVFEGACTYSKGAWRPTENSIMRYNTGGYNAPSREAIWYRAHKLAYGESWQYDYEEFVAYDAVNRKTSSGAATSGGRHILRQRPTHAPVIVPRRWNETPESVASYHR
jgi:hypothetical protein